MTRRTSIAFAAPPSPSPAARFALVLGLAPALLGLACDPGDDPEPMATPLQARVLVGTVDDTDLALGALLDGDILAVYQCGGDTTFASHTRWFRGVLGLGDDPDGFELRDGDMTLLGIRTADGLEGELLEPDGTRHPFAVDPVADDGEPGVYVAAHDGLSTGVIVRPQAGELVAQGASCSTPGECSQVIILPPLDLTARSLDVQVEHEGDVLDVVVERTLVAP